jgi:hypothetical protein
MEAGPQDLLELRRAPMTKPSWFLDLAQPEIGGGRLDTAELSLIEENPHAVALRVSGLDQRTLERLVTGFGSQFEAIEFWKCPRLEDLTPLEELPQLRMVSIYWNQRSPRLWNLARTPRLSALRFEDFTRLHTLDDLRDARALEELAFGDAVWSKSTFETLEPLAALTGMRSLSLHPRRIDDGRVQPLGLLANIERLSIPSNLFTTEQIAWLRARLPPTVESAALAALIRLEKPLEFDGKLRDVLLVGKRKPFLNSEVDAARIQKHVRTFEAMVSAFQVDPSLEPSATSA